jgi:hypothetical protein
VLAALASRRCLLSTSAHERAAQPAQRLAHLKQQVTSPPHNPRQRYSVVVGQLPGTRASRRSTRKLQQGSATWYGICLTVHEQLDAQWYNMQAVRDQRRTQQCTSEWEQAKAAVLITSFAISPLSPDMTPSQRMQYSVIVMRGIGSGHFCFSRLR